MTAARHLHDASALPAPAELIAQLSTADELARRRRIHEVIERLAREKTVLQNEYRDAIQDAGFFGKRDWILALSEAKKTLRDAKRGVGVLPDLRYSVGDDGWLYAMGDDGPVQLANFSATITAYVTQDDGLEQTSLVRLRVVHAGGRVGTVDIPAERLGRVREWAIQAIGPEAAVMPMSRDEQHVLAAVQLLSRDWERLTQYTCTGWTVADGRRRFLTASGALHADGLDATVCVDLGNDRLNQYALPDPTTVDVAQLRAAVRASLSLIDLADDTVMVPTLAAAYRAPLPIPPETSIFSVGRSGSLKTAVAAVICSHFGAGIDHRNLAASWTGTSNAIEAIAYSLANVLCVIDDYAPQAVDDPRRLAATADRVLRGVANHSGRDRLRVDGRVRHAKPPRAQILTTGEDTPDIHSLRARITTVEYGRGTINLAKLTDAQRSARDGVYALAMAGYVRWLAAEWDAEASLSARLRQQMLDLRSSIAASGHLREPEAAAGLLTGWVEMLRYAEEVGAINGGERRRLYRRAEAAVTTTITQQSAQNAGFSPSQIYVQALKGALAGGGAHLASIDDGGMPDSGHPTRWGWRKQSAAVDGWQARGTCIGYVDGDGEILLQPESAYVVAREYAAKSGANLGTTRTTLHKRLAEDGCLASKPTGRLEVQRHVPGGRRERLLHLRAALLVGETCEDKAA